MGPLPWVLLKLTPRVKLGAWGLTPLLKLWPDSSPDRPWRAGSFGSAPAVFIVPDALVTSFVACVVDQQGRALLQGQSQADDSIVAVMHRTTCHAWCDNSCRTAVEHTVTVPVQLQFHAEAISYYRYQSTEYSLPFWCHVPRSSQ